MKCYDNPRVSDWMVREVQKRMFERSGDRSTGPLHASDIYSCFRRVVQSRRTPVPYNKETILKFALGFALQDFFFGPEQDGEEIFGVILSADRLIKGQVLEFKTTRKSPEKYLKDDNGKLLKHLPKVQFNPEDNPSWIQRTLAYCAAHNVNKAHIGVFFLYQSDLRAWTLEFTNEELAAAVEDIERRRDELTAYLAAPDLPPVSTRMGDWECGFCPYMENCINDLRAEGFSTEEAE